MKEEILNFITMEDILNKYNIANRHSMFSCPFHADKTPSAKAYKNTFYCFSCNRHGDIIQFIQYYFNLSFRQAMQKINEDFNLGLNINEKIDYSKIEEIKQQRLKKEEEKKNLNKYFISLCNKKQKYIELASSLNSQIKLNNWENIVYRISKLKDKIYLIDDELDQIENKLSSRC